jgi:hypothetical protein
MTTESSDNLPEDEEGTPPAALAAAESREPEKICTSCGEGIQKSAIVCRQCRNYQGRWWWFRLVALSLPWLTVLFGLGVWLYNQLNKSMPNAFMDIDATVQSFDGDNFSIDVINSYNGPIFLGQPKIECQRIGDPWTGTLGDPGFGATLSTEHDAAEPIGRGEFRALQYHLNHGIDRKRLLSIHNVSCVVWLNYTTTFKIAFGVLGQSLSSSSIGKGIFIMAPGPILDAFLNGDRWPP